jgi:hypothetical protein
MEFVYEDPTGPKRPQDHHGHIQSSICDTLTDDVRQTDLAAAGLPGRRQATEGAGGIAEVGGREASVEEHEDKADLPPAAVVIVCGGCNSLGTDMAKTWASRASHVPQTWLSVSRSKAEVGGRHLQDGSRRTARCNTYLRFR